MPVQHTKDENQSSWWIIELGGQLTVRLCLHKGKHPVNSAKKKKKYSLVTGKKKLVDQDHADKIKCKHKYNTTVKFLEDFTNLKERVYKGETFDVCCQKSTKKDSLILCRVILSSFSCYFYFILRMWI